MFEDIIVNKDMSYDDILELSEEILIPIEELLLCLKSMQK